MKLTTIVSEVKAKWYYDSSRTHYLFPSKIRKHNHSQIEQSFRVAFRLGNREDQEFFSIGCHLFNRFDFLSEAIHCGYRGDYWNVADDEKERVEFNKYLQLDEFEKVVNWVSELPPIRTEIPRIQHQKQLTLFLKNQ